MSLAEGRHGPCGDALEALGVPCHRLDACSSTAPRPCPWRAAPRGGCGLDRYRVGLGRDGDDRRWVLAHEGGQRRPADHAGLEDGEEGLRDAAEWPARRASSTVEGHLRCGVIELVEIAHHGAGGERLVRDPGTPAWCSAGGFGAWHYVVTRLGDDRDRSRRRRSLES